MTTPCINSVMASTTPRGKQARQSLIDAGLTLFAQRGLEGATTRDIALASGQNIAAITYYFHSKQGLYLAVAQWIADTLNASFHPLRTECERFLSRSDATPQAYLALIQRAIAHLCHLMTQPQTLHLSQIISREQMLPSAASPILHDQFISPLHTLMTRLVAGYAGLDATQPAAALHTHALIGQVLAFRMARETILNRTGWPQIGPAQAQAIHEVVQMHTELLMNGLRQRGVVGNVRKPS
ncbi:transcriptional regulator [Edwardsiella ictaluri]|uniref:Transcriptional regulator, TetR family n=2 Tax=Edwardsiella ictaluri TaxID=67780 RepID=C5BFZ6_EDWI9|nr:transcriptional regulator CecR [Edwardsiella ictaluri]ACR69790.2 transcriptional regulator, TetR family [Edwardsiella ictaluri 93-146]AVZ83257.1 transcriptional regulator [Edwardsiella ictaluri]EKS7761867.1 transcriptional regulator CecR [Edwardsiella ictaluri]EKS7768677.1 transcriptional regulator CecR [Edwardsiella ictaluri]EKS7772005.1 transcriptional regulator CecR [Edwardsiella ictaluri]